MIAGIVLAAGRSRRMGEPKPFLRLDGQTFLERAVTALRGGGCGEVVVVTGPMDDETPRRVAEAAAALGARTAENPAAGSEQVDSLRVGLRALSAGAAAVVVLPVDVPRADAALVAAVIEVHRRTGAPVARPAAGGRHGHPVLFARAVFAELLEGGLPDGARTVIHAHARETAEVPVPALPGDVDTPEDFRRLTDGA